MGFCCDWFLNFTLYINQIILPLLRCDISRGAFRIQHNIKIISNILGHQRTSKGNTLKLQCRMMLHLRKPLEKKHKLFMWPQRSKKNGRLIFKDVTVIWRHNKLSLQHKQWQQCWVHLFQCDVNAAQHHSVFLKHALLCSDHQSEQQSNQRGRGTTTWEQDRGAACLNPWIQGQAEKEHLLFRCTQVRHLNT